MPCQTGRAGHILLKKDCQTGCACCVNTTYSCGKLGCNEEIENDFITLNLLKHMICDIYNQVNSETPIDAETTEDVARFICDNVDRIANLPKKQYSFTVTVKQLSIPNSQSLYVTELVNGQCVNPIFDSPPGNDLFTDAEWTIIIDDIICLTFDSTLS